MVYIDFGMVNIRPRICHLYLFRSIYSNVIYTVPLLSMLQHYPDVHFKVDKPLTLHFSVETCDLSQIRHV